MKCGKYIIMMSGLDEILAGEWRAFWGFRTGWTVCVCGVFILGFGYMSFFSAWIIFAYVLYTRIPAVQKLPDLLKFFLTI